MLPVTIWFPIKMFDPVVAKEPVFIEGLEPVITNKDPVPSYMLTPSVWRTL
jgi:hypothetical protein